MSADGLNEWHVVRGSREFLFLHARTQLGPHLGDAWLCPKSALYFPSSSLALVKGRYGVSTLRRSPVQWTAKLGGCANGSLGEHQANRRSKRCAGLSTREIELVARADERLAHAYEQIARADEQLARVNEQISKMEQDAAPKKFASGYRRPSRGRPALRGLVGLLLTAGICIAAFASQSSGVTAKLMNSRWATQLLRLRRCRWSHRNLPTSRAHLPFSWLRRIFRKYQLRLNPRRKTRQPPRFLPS